jgi:predicted transposase/invertase (TIGR01784 family)
MSRKTLQELTIKDNFLFAATMMDSDNCRDVLECAIGIPIDYVEVSREKSIVYHPEYRGIRLDVFAKDEKHTRYNVEMQIAKQEIFRRSRYYHGQMDMELLASGMEYEELPDCYVIFICDYDPVGLGRYRYTKRDTFAEEPSYEYDDGSHTIFLNTKGTNEDEVPKQLVTFLKFVGASLEDSTADYQDALVSRLQASVRKIKADREMENRYMVLEEMMKNEYKAGRLEGRLDGKRDGIILLLERYGQISESLRNTILSVSEMEVLDKLFVIAARTESIESFEQEVEGLRLS